MFVEVLLDQNLAKPLDYSVPEGLHVEVGMRVEVPLKGTVKRGTISAVKNQSRFESVKPIVKLLSHDISEPLWKLAQWISAYYCAPLQRVLKCFVPVNMRKTVQQKTEVFLKLAKTHAESLKLCEELRLKSPAQAQVLEELLNANKGLFLKNLSVSRSAVTGLIGKKWITAEKIIPEADLLLEEEFFPTKPKILNEEQKASLEVIKTALHENRFSTHLIHGITGSGKTEVYMQAITAALEQGKSAIMLVPEISLTSQTIERFRSRFSEKIAILHHRRSLGERNTAWEQLRNNEARIVVGARSAIFCPAQNLGLIIVDEEHDNSYKQNDEIPCYHGRDVAVMRAHFENCPILLGSATPSIESRYNVEIGKYRLHTLQSRATVASLPEVKIVDMKKACDRAGGFTHFSDELLEGLKKRLKTGEQSLLFLNRRGTHRMQICSACRHVVKCPHCDLALTFHRSSNHLQCHLCNHAQTAPRQCPECHNPESLQFKGFGTEHVERSLHAIFPEIRTLRMDKDTTRQKNSHEELFKQFRAHKADVMIGTQMIAKGFHFPSVTLVGILNTDATLSIPDFRSPEQVFQLVTQVAGRSGRAELPGEVIIQTYLPDHATIRTAASQDYNGFYKAEIEDRRMFGYPPFIRLIKLLFTAPELETAQTLAQETHARLTALLPPPTVVLSPTPSGYTKIKDQYRFQFIIKTPKILSVSTILKDLDVPGLKIDVDPLSTFL